MNARAPIVATGDRQVEPELASRVRTLLARGELCALPTETVYGLAARADDPGALEGLRAMKGRPSDLGFTWHVHERSAIERFASLRPLVRRLAERYWPGPLTLVLRGIPEGCEGIARDGWTGLRLPAHRACIELLAACDFPVAMTSANRHGRPPATDAGQVVEQFGEELALVVDGGPSRLGEASGVLALGPGRFQLLREGLLRIEDLRRTAGLRIAFVCTGNTCRSPMAEALARALLAERLQVSPDAGTTLASFGFELASMGIHAIHGAPASPGALEVLGERGLDLACHRSRAATPEALARFDRVYSLTEAHREALRAQLPPGRHPPIFLLDPDGADVPDPLGGPRAAYEQALAGIERALRRRLDEWA